MHREDGIRCNAVLPGGVATNIYANSQVSLDPEGYKRFAPLQGCMPRSIAMPGAISSAVLWLCGNESVTGAEIKVDGGWTCH
jgi:NAD(P)-dependent dehydrogenase (short-subunit alcohol dehydrogenase family)